MTSLSLNHLDLALEAGGNFTVFGFLSPNLNDIDLNRSVRSFDSMNNKDSYFQKRQMFSKH